MPEPSWTSRVQHLLMLVLVLPHIKLLSFQLLMLCSLMPRQSLHILPASQITSKATLAGWQEVFNHSEVKCGAGLPLAPEHSELRFYPSRL